MSALAVRESSAAVVAQMRRYRREGCRLAAMILLAEPERIGDEPIGDFLLRIEYLKRDTASEWLRRVGVNPWRACSQLTNHQRRLIAGLLVQYSKAGE